MLITPEMYNDPAGCDFVGPSIGPPNGDNDYTMPNPFASDLIGPGGLPGDFQTDFAPFDCDIIGPGGLPGDFQLDFGPSNDFLPPGLDFGPSNDFLPPSLDFGPSNDFLPGLDLMPPSLDFLPPSLDFGPSNDFLPPSFDLGPGPFDCDIVGPGGGSSGRGGGGNVWGNDFMPQFEAGNIW
jgi:hypothetical protein